MVLKNYKGLFVFENNEFYILVQKQKWTDMINSITENLDYLGNDSIANSAVHTGIQQFIKFVKTNSRPDEYIDNLDTLFKLIEKNTSTFNNADKLLDELVTIIIPIHENVSSKLAKKWANKRPETSISKEIIKKYGKNITLTESPDYHSTDDDGPINGFNSSLQEETTHKNLDQEIKKISFSYYTRKDGVSLYIQNPTSIDNDTQDRLKKFTQNRRAIFYNDEIRLNNRPTIKDLIRIFIEYSIEATIVETNSLEKKKGKILNNIADQSSPSKKDLLVNFGEHKGKQWKDIPISYIEWVATNFNDPKKRELAKAILSEIKTS